MIYLVNNLNIKKVLNKYLLGTCLTSYITRTIIYSAIMFFFFSSFNEFFQNPQYGATTFKDAYGHVFDFYFFNGFIGSYLTLMFMIENIITFLNMINKRNQELIYRVGRTNDFYKTYITRSLKAILCSGLIILLACVIVDIVIIAINFICTGRRRDNIRNDTNDTGSYDELRLFIFDNDRWYISLGYSYIICFWIICSCHSN
ncbi:MAG: hypothetical protein LBT75_05220, partial [Bacilli bacterium]|nr:hypothetical protein [Bacilli bacterium]